ncbi:MAG: triose-phosphate isomerase, partial [Thaumarchaeota archaeon]|nr:triose-phosphate isomerase [Nitrososphaerota archaeon]
MFVINFKNYDEIAGENSIRLTKITTEVAKKYGITIAVCPPLHLLSEISKISHDVFAQHLDNSKVGSTTGFLVPEIVKKSRVSGALINHSEHRIPSNEIEDLVTRLRELQMTSVVCV